MLTLEDKQQPGKGEVVLNRQYTGPEKSLIMAMVRELSGQIDEALGEANIPNPRYPSNGVAEPSPQVE